MIVGRFVVCVVVDSWFAELSVVNNVWWTVFAGPLLFVVPRHAGGALVELHPEEERCQ